MLRNFGIQPRVAWQIDPFGHSKITPSIFKMMGYDSLVINRIHHAVKSYLKRKKGMEFIWNGSDIGCNPDCAMFTHVLHHHYSAPPGFDWEESWPPAPAITTANIDLQARRLIDIFRVYPSSSSNVVT